MISIPVSEFRANMPAFIKKLQRGEKIVLTSHGRVVAHVTPPTEEQEEARNRLRKIMKTAWIGDVVSPINADWKVQRDDFDPFDRNK